LDFVPQRHHAHRLRQLAAQLLEVDGGEVGHEARPPEHADDALAGGVVVLEGAGRDLLVSSRWRLNVRKRFTRSRRVRPSPRTRGVRPACKSPFCSWYLL